MKALIIIGTLLVLTLIITPAITGLSVKEEIKVTCNEGTRIVYYYSPTCSHCIKTASVITELENNGCIIDKVNVANDYERAINEGILAIPTIIINDQKITGEFSLEQVKNLIEQ